MPEVKAMDFSKLSVEKLVVDIPQKELDEAKTYLTAPWLAFTAFTVFAVMLSLLIFIFEGVRDAFDPRKTFS